MTTLRDLPRLLDSLHEVPARFRCAYRPTHAGAGFVMYENLAAEVDRQLAAEAAILADTERLEAMISALIIERDLTAALDAVGVQPAMRSYVAKFLRQSWRFEVPVPDAEPEARAARVLTPYGAITVGEAVAGWANTPEAAAVLTPRAPDPEDGQFAREVRALRTVH